MKKTVLALIINGDPLLRLRFTRVLGVEGYEVLWADRLNETLMLCAQRRVDLLLVDFNRPLRSALNDFERLTSAYPGLPFLLLTDHPAELERSVGEEVGAVLEKPFGNIVLAHTIHTLLCELPRVVAQTAPSGAGSKPTARKPSPLPQSGRAETESDPTYEVQDVAGGR